MKRSHSSDEEKEKKEKRPRIAAITAITTNSTTTASGVDVGTGRVRRVGSHLKHHLRRAPSHASSAVEYMKSEWTSEELDLTNELKPIISFLDNSFEFVEEIFSVFSIGELKDMTPDLLKDLSIDDLKEICLEELKSIPVEKIKLICEGKDPEEIDKLLASQPKSNHNKGSIGSTDKISDIQLSVDDNEYSDFLGAENSDSKITTKDAEVQANDSSLDSSSDDEEGQVSDDGREGWMNIFAKTQMEILELEMRARAIRSLMKAQEDEEESQLEDVFKTIATNGEKLDEYKEQEKQTVDEEIGDKTDNEMISDKDLDLNQTKPEEENTTETEITNDSYEEITKIETNRSENRFENFEKDNSLSDGEIVDEDDKQSPNIESKSDYLIISDENVNEFDEELDPLRD